VDLITAQVGSFSFLKFGSLLALARCQPLFEIWLIVSLSPLSALLDFGPLSAPFEVWLIVSSGPLLALLNLNPTITCRRRWPLANLYLY
jgi:hypothetical protein